ncbi:MAG: AAA family ATPase [bacterium]
MNKEYDIYVTKILNDMEEEREKLAHPFVGSEHLLLSLIKNDNEIKKMFENQNITYEIFQNKLISTVGIPKNNTEFNLYTPLLKRVINFAIEEAKISDDTLNAKYLLESLLEENEGVAIRILLSLEVDLDLLYKSINQKGTTGEEKIIFGKNLTEEVDINENVIGREKEIQFIIETLLRKKKSNPLLIGEAGVGKSAVVEELARMIKKGKVPTKLRNSKIISIDMSSVVSGTKYRGEFEEKLTNIITSCEENQDIILFIDEIHTIINAGGAEGAIGASDIFKPCLARGNIKVIGATTTIEYNKYIAKDKALQRRFETIMIKEPSVEETIEILTKIKEEYEKFHSVKITNKNVIDIVNLSDKFIKNKRNPDKSIDFLDSVSSYIQIKNDNLNQVSDYENELKIIKDKKNIAVVNKEYEKALKYSNIEEILKLKTSNNNKKTNNKISYKDIVKVLETKVNIPININRKNIEKKIKETFLDLNISSKIEKLILTKLEDITKIRSCLILGEADKIVINIKKILPTINYIKIRGEEYKHDESITKLKGSNPGYVGYNEEHVFSKLKYNSYALIYIENIDKCSIVVKNFFNEIIKDGYIIDSKQEKIYLNNALIVFSKENNNKNKVGFNNSNEEDIKDKTNYDVVINVNEKKVVQM